MTLNKIFSVVVSFSRSLYWHLMFTWFPLCLKYNMLQKSNKIMVCNIWGVLRHISRGRWGGHSYLSSNVIQGGGGSFWSWQANLISTNVYRYLPIRKTSLYVWYNRIWSVYGPYVVTHLNWTPNLLVIYIARLASEIGNNLKDACYN